VPRVRRTHKDDIISLLLSMLSLRKKLSKNKEIEDQNKARELKNFNHHLDPATYPEAGSENASFITIDKADLKDPSILARFSNFPPDFLLLRITREIRAEKEERDKRRLDELNSHATEPSQVAKRRRMDGSSKAADRIIGSQRDIEFSDILFTTNAHVPIPLPFFRNENLHYIIDQAATLPTTKSNPLPGEMKGQFILNIFDLTKDKKTCKGFGKELSLDFGEWSGAAQNCFCFFTRYKDGDMGPYATWWSSHFNFFNVQEDKISQYNAWKDLELKLRREYRTEPTKFDINHYAMKYEAAKTMYELKLLIDKRDTFSTFFKDALAPPHKDGFRPSSGSRGGQYFTLTHQI
jgi:hypothetical protein